jgi:hypothetical protein
VRACVCVCVRVSVHVSGALSVCIYQVSDCWQEHVVVNAAADARGLWQVLLLQLLEVAPVEADPIVTAVRLSCSTRDRVHRSSDLSTH